MDLTAQNVDTVVKDCLFRDDEIEDNKIPDGAVIVEGVVLKLGFHPERLKKHEDDIISMLNQLPDEFRLKTGGGWSFLQACMTKDGRQWGEHRDIDALLCMGIGIKKAEIQLPREMWFAFPGGVPYFAIKE